MSLTPSNMIKLGTKAPDFRLLNVKNNQFLSLSEIKGKHGTVIMFICNHCPFVKHVNEELVRFANDYKITGFGFVAISSNDVKNYPEDHPDKMAEVAETQNYPFPYLYDETQEVAKAYKAACTPDFYVFDENLDLFYRGQLDDSRPKNGLPLTGRNLREALDALLNNRRPPKIQKPSMGCNIKWKSN
ncbi:thioredoxin family protein [Mesohalobacter halotolerans]|uniref:Thioredoxin family protein n=1 Tax=Mesohalobacter halotolerans TaxID=1883405 RepID=A0A4U5TPD2_9FLAO|nr:thioredoxin family protein [Mesohalobacter halotolerans]MBS3738829.1 thioredoxin family protein [Psychroflexus sp.]TKS55541.1 thioredoxin family protein [Mesohalobacter halotolerans]